MFHYCTVCLYLFILCVILICRGANEVKKEEERDWRRKHPQKFIDGLGFVIL